MFLIIYECKYYEILQVDRTAVDHVFNEGSKEWYLGCTQVRDEDIKSVGTYRCGVLVRRKKYKKSCNRKTKSNEKNTKSVVAHTKEQRLAKNKTRMTPEIWE